MSWTGDNTQVGTESILIDMTRLVHDYPQQSEFRIDCRAFWFGELVSGELQIEFETYSGGTMHQIEHDYQNSGGHLKKRFQVTTMTEVNNPSNDEQGELLAYLIYKTMPYPKGKFVAIPQKTIAVNNLNVRNDEMSQAKLTWSNTSNGSFSQIVEKKINEGEWEEISLNIESLPESPSSYSALDPYIVFNEDTQVTYRIITINGSLRVFGNETSLNIPAMPAQVVDLSAVVIDD
jgi:hypothetical protein